MCPLVHHHTPQRLGFRGLVFRGLGFRGQGLGVCPLVSIHRMGFLFYFHYRFDVLFIIHHFPDVRIYIYICNIYLYDIYIYDIICIFSYSLTYMRMRNL
jgi:hypothetical protein